MDTGPKTTRNMRAPKTRYAEIVWMSLSLLLFIVTLLLAGALAYFYVTLSYRENKCTQGSCWDPRPIPLPASHSRYTFPELSAHEIKEVIEYVKKQPDINIVAHKDAAVDKSYIALIEAYPAKKTDVLAYLTGEKRNQPIRYAKVVVYRGDKTTPVVQEYKVGAVENPTTHLHINQTKMKNPIPFNARPMDSVEERTIRERFLIPFGRNLTKLTIESFNASYHEDPCTRQCLTYGYATPPGKVSGERITWFWFMRKLEHPNLHTLPLQVYIDHSGNDVNKWRVVKVWYNGRSFHTVDKLIREYDLKHEIRIIMPWPMENWELFSAVKQRGGYWWTAKRAPRLLEPDGRRFVVSGRSFHYAGWTAHLHMRSSTGLQMYNVQFRGARILYELSLQQITSMHSGYAPKQMRSFYFGTSSFIGRQSLSLVRGVDCPDTAVYLQTVHYDGILQTIPDSICIFEMSSDAPLRRHHGRDSAHRFSFFGGMSGSYLVIRSIASLFGMDHIVDYQLYENGAIGIKTALSGFHQLAFHTSTTDEEKKYGFLLRDHLMGTLFNHLFHFKVDLDIHGRLNMHQIVSVEGTIASDPWVTGTYNLVHMQKLKTMVKVAERLATSTYNFNRPEYYLFYNKNVTTKHGLPRAYRIKIDSMSPVLLSKGEGPQKGVSWADYQLAVTKYKDDEATSSSIYSGFDPYDPITNFETYLKDNESIVNQDLVAWVTLGAQRIPKAEDFPTITTTGEDMRFFILPFNYFDEDPSIYSTRNVRLEHSKKDPVEGNMDKRFCWPKVTPFKFKGDTVIKD